MRNANTVLTSNLQTNCFIGTYNVSYHSVHYDLVMHRKYLKAICNQLYFGSYLYFGILVVIGILVFWSLLLFLVFWFLLVFWSLLVF